MASASSWTVAQVCDFFRELRLERYVDTLQQNDIDGETLLGALGDDQALLVLGLDALAISKLRTKLKKSSGPEAPPQAPPQSEYEPVSILGEGSFGTTVLARHRASGQQFAIKQMLAANLAAANTALQEALLMKEVQHPLLVRAITAYLEEMTLGRYQVPQRECGAVRQGTSTGTSTGTSAGTSVGMSAGTSVGTRVATSVGTIGKTIAGTGVGTSSGDE